MLAHYVHCVFYIIIALFSYVLRCFVFHFISVDSCVAPARCSDIGESGRLLVWC